MENKNYLKIEPVAFYICCFFVYCLVGWIYEVITMYSLGFGFVNRGFLYGCYLPLYGFAGLLFILITRPFINKKIKIGKLPVKLIVIFLLVAVVSTFIEYTTSIILEKCFNLILWDYSDYKINLNGRIALASSCCFGIGGLIMFYGIQPMMERLRKALKPKITIITAIIISVTMVTDLIITLITK